MGLQIKIHKEEPATVLELTGRLTISDPLNEFETSIQELLTEGVKHILVDLANVAYVDSSGLGVLIGALTRVSRAGGELKLINVPRRVQALLDISNIGRISEQLKATSSSTGTSGN